jgi:hypothetical protein
MNAIEKRQTPGRFTAESAENQKRQPVSTAVFADEGRVFHPLVLDIA